MVCPHTRWPTMDHPAGTHTNPNRLPRVRDIRVSGLLSQCHTASKLFFSDAHLPHSLVSRTLRTSAGQSSGYEPVSGLCIITLCARPPNSSCQRCTPPGPPRALNSRTLRTSAGLRCGMHVTGEFSQPVVARMNPSHEPVPACESLRSTIAAKPASHNLRTI